MSDFSAFVGTVGTDNDNAPPFCGWRLNPVAAATLDGPGTQLLWYRTAGSSTRGGPVTAGNVPAGSLIERISR